MTVTINLYALKVIFLARLRELQQFQFYFSNPVFWLCVLIVFLVLLRFWHVKKSFSFSVLAAAILLVTTQVEHLVVDFVRQHGETFDPIIIRVLSVFAIIILFVYYSMIRGNSSV